MNTTNLFHKKSDNLSRSYKGQGAVEFALVAPVLFLIVFGMIEVGRLLFIYGAVTNAAREAARYGSATGVDTNATDGVDIMRYNDCAGIRSAAMNMGFLANLQSTDVVIEFDTGPNTTRTTANCYPATNNVATNVVTTETLLCKALSDGSNVLFQRLRRVDIRSAPPGNGVC